MLAPGRADRLQRGAQRDVLHRPAQPDHARYWTAYNEHQIELGGDPFVGAKLGNLLPAAGFRDVTTHVQSFFLDGRDALARADMLAYFDELLLSAAPGLLEAGRVTPAIVEATRAELAAAAVAPDGVFFYSSVGAVALA